MLKKHLTAGSKILLIVDPDVDGFTSSALFYNYLTDNYKNKRGFNFELSYHIPDGKEHGLDTLLKDLTKNKVADLIVCADSSSNDYDSHKALKEMGYDILVLDHHNAPTYSENAVVINNQLSKNYSNKDLSGVGVVYKFFEYFEVKERQQLEEPGDDLLIWNYMDLVALGLISDMMAMLTLENRYICDYGLSYLRNQFFKDLVEKQSYSLGDGPLTQIGVAFYITPLINALIRVGNSIEKERLFQAFITPNELVPSTKRGEKGLTETISTQSVRNCVNAKARQNREKDKAIEMLNIQIMDNCLENNKILILNADELDIPNTLTGLCAMGVAAQHKKPVILGRTSPDGKLKGSMRGREESELKDFQKFLQDTHLIDYCEGHANAAGASLPLGNIDKLNAYANETLKDINFNEGFYEADFVVKGNCSYLPTMIEELDRGKALYGQGCKEPIIIAEDITIDPKTINIIGKNADTIRFTFNGVTYIKFKATELIDQIKSYSDKINITAAGRANVNHWGGRITPQIQIDEIEIKEISKYDF